MIICGIDPGTIKMGFCIYNTTSKTIIVSGSISTDKWRKLHDSQLGLLKQTSLYIQDLTEFYHPDVLWVERTFAHTALYSSLLVIMTNVIFETAKSFVKECDIKEVKSWRKLMCGKGNINKEECINYVNERFNKTFQSDEAEAIGIALAAANFYEKRNLISNSEDIPRKPKKQSKRKKLSTPTSDK